MSHQKIVEANQVLYKSPYGEGNVTVKHALSGGINIEDVDSINVASIKSKGGVEAMTLTDDTVEFKLPFGLDMNDVNMTEVDIDSGTIDGATIGASSASTAKFTTLETTSTSVIGDHMQFKTAKELRFGTAGGGSSCKIEGDNVTMQVSATNFNLQGTTATSLRGGTVTVDAAGTLNLQASDAENYLVCNHSTEKVEIIKEATAKSHMNFETAKELRFGTASGGSACKIQGDNSTMQVSAPTFNLQGTTATSLRGGTITVDAATDLNLKASDNEAYITCSHSNARVEIKKPLDVQFNTSFNNKGITGLNALIPDQPNMTGDVADADELLISDGGTCKRVDFSVLRDAVYNDVSGAVTIADGGSASITIASNSVSAAMLNDGCISGQSALGSASLHQTQDEFLLSDNGLLKKVTFSNLEDSIFGNVSGDITIAAGGAATIGNDAVESDMLNNNCISGQGALGSASMAQADLLLIDDGPGTLKKVTFSNFEDSIFGNVSGNATVAAGGALTIASNCVTAGMLNDGCISGQSALGSASLHQTQDELLISDNGLLKKVTFSNLEDSIFGNVSGDITIAAGGAATIGNDAVESDMLNNNCISGQGALGSASMAQADLLLIDDGPGTLKKVTFSNFEDSIFGNVSGDATLAAGGAISVKSAVTTFSKKSVVTTDSTGNRTITGAEMIGGYFHMAGASGGSTPTLTTDTAANIVAAMNNPVVGSSFELHIQNTATGGGQKIVVAVGTGVTAENLSGSSADIPENFSRNYLVIATNVSGGSEAVTFRQLGKRDMR